MIDQIKELIAEAEAFKAQTKEEVEAYRIKLLGQKGIVKQYFAEFKKVISCGLAPNKSAILFILIDPSNSEFVLPLHVSIIFFIEKGPLFLKKMLPLTFSLFL